MQPTGPSLLDLRVQGTIKGLGDWRLETRQPSRRINRLAVSPDSKFIATAHAAGIVRIYDAHSHELLQFLDAHVLDVNAIAWSPNSELLATAGEDGIAKVWRRDGSRVAKVDCQSRVNDLAFSPSGEWVVAGCYRPTILMLFKVDGSEQRRLEGHTSDVWSVDWAVDGRLASGSSDESIRIWTLDEARSRVLLQNVGQVTAVAWSPDGTKLAAGYRRNTFKLRFWTKDGESLGEVDTGQTRFLNEVAWSPDGKIAAATCADHTVYLSRSDGTVVTQVRHDHAATGAAWIGADDLVTGGWDAGLRFWNRNGKAGRVLRDENRFAALFGQVADLDQTAAYVLRRPDGTSGVLPVAGFHRRLSFPESSASFAERKATLAESLIKAHFPDVGR